MEKQLPITIEKVAQVILYIRNQKVILDTDLARIYGVQTKRLNEQVKRNKDRFPSDFMFKLTDDELQEVVANCDHLKNLKYSNTTPNAFTEHGALMLSSVLHTSSAVETSLYIVRAFVKLRELLSSHESLERKIHDLEAKYEKNFTIIFEALKQLLIHESKPRKRIGYRPSNEK